MTKRELSINLALLLSFSVENVICGDETEACRADMSSSVPRFEHACSFFHVHSVSCKISTQPA